MSANNTGPRHYKDKPMQPWDFIVSNGLGFLEGNIVKYISRWRDKGGVDDLRKAKHYLEKLIELEVNAEASGKPTALESAELKRARDAWETRTKKDHV